MLLPVVGGLLGYYYANSQERVYEASGTLLVQQRGSNLLPGISDANLSAQVASKYSTLMKTTPFLGKALDNSELPLSAGALKAMITATTGSKPPTVNISVRGNDPKLVAEAAQLVATEFMDFVIEERLAEIAKLQQAAAAQGIADVPSLIAAQFSLVDTLMLLEPVKVPSRPILPQPRKNTILGVLIGTLLAGGVVVLLVTLSDTVRTPEDLRRRFRTTALGTIFKWSLQDVGESELVVWTMPSSGYSESFRQVRTNLQFATVNTPGKVYLVTSPSPSEGKSTIICNLAVALAQAGKRVVLVDGDLRRPAIHNRFQCEGREPGLSSYLAMPETSFGDVLQTTQVDGVHIIAGGAIPPNPSELLGSSRMMSLFEEATEFADVVLVDSPPVLMVADTSILASQVDGAIVVVDGFSTRSSSLRAALEVLTNTHVSVMGVILNKLKRTRFGYGYPYYYYDYYNYKDYSSEDSERPLSNGRQPLHRRPIGWARSVLSRIRSRRG